MKSTYFVIIYFVYIHGNGSAVQNYHFDHSNSDSVTKMNAHNQGMRNNCIFSYNGQLFRHFLAFSLLNF